MHCEFVPVGLTRLARQRLSGDEEAKGLYAEKAEALTELINVNAEIRHWTVCDPQEGFSSGDPYYDHLQAQVGVYSNCVQDFEREIAFYQRLLDPELMQDAYRWLDHFGDSKWALFVLSARQARLEFETFRRLQKQARELSKAIEKNAKTLAQLIRGLRETGVVLPATLTQTFEAGDLGESFYGSRELRHAKFQRMISVARSSSAKEMTKDAVKWLYEVASAAASVEARFACPAVTAAITKRQNSKKSAYLRAFAAMLEEAQIDLSSNVMKAMAVTANVVFDEPNFDTCEDDVRKAIHRSSDQARALLTRKTQPKKMKLSCL